ncbi:hypothetical protein WG219_06560 [Ectopseudomonas mendocina]|uniref:Uncharacterized protein n=1 Tax=Ectopseudomonas mendocina TaxID=300 RepID=A0ABZ2RR28_ECTME
MSSDSEQPVDVQDFIDQQPVGRFHLLLVALGFAITEVDVFDTAAIGFIARLFVKAWGFQPYL